MGCVLSTLKSVGLCVVAPLVCGASCVTCCQNKQVKDKMWWWCNQASQNNCCSCTGEIIGSCADPKANGGEPVCWEYCMTDCMGRTGKRREEKHAIAKRKEYLKEQNRKVERKAPKSPISEMEADVTYLDGYAQNCQNSQEDVKEHSSRSSESSLEAPPAPQKSAEPTTKSDHRGGDFFDGAAAGVDMYDC